MAPFFAGHGLDLAGGIGAAVLYRVVAFWLPVVASAGLLLLLWRRGEGTPATPAGDRGGTSR